MTILDPIIVYTSNVNKYLQFQQNMKIILLVCMTSRFDFTLNIFSQRYSSSSVIISVIFKSSLLVKMKAKLKHEDRNTVARQS